MTTPPEFPPAPPTSPQEPRFEVSAGVLDLMKQTKPYVRFFSILGFISCGLMALGGIAAAIGGGVTGEPQGIGIGLAYLLFAVLYIFPAMFLAQYAGRIGDLLRSGAERDLEEAIGKQKSFWKFMGILAIVMLCLYVLIFIFALLAGALSVM